MVEPPEWFGLRYPTLADLEDLAEQLGAVVIWTRSSQAAYRAAYADVSSAIYIPRHAGLLQQHWLLAHELGHLVHHSGPKGGLSHGREEWTAKRWAACALIPMARIQAYANASQDALIGALSAHYEDIPFNDCPSRELAAEIARIRIKDLEDSCPKQRRWALERSSQSVVEA